MGAAETAKGLALLSAVLLLVAAPGARAAPSVVADPASHEVQIELPATGVTEVEVGPFNEFVIVDSWQLEVTQSGPTSLGVSTRGPGARGVVMVSDATGWRTLVLRGALTTSAGPPPRDFDSPFQADAAIGGNYWVAGTGSAAPAASLYHWGGWRQQVQDVALDAYAGVLTNLPGQSGLSDIVISANHPVAGVIVGDFGVVLAPSISGVQGGGATLRGVGVRYSPGGGDARVGLMGGVGRPTGCCEYFAPERLWLAAATGGWRPSRGFWTEGLAGVMKRDVDPGVTPIAQVGAGFSRPGIDLAASFTQSGPGSSAALRVHGVPSTRIALRLDAAWASAAFRRPLALDDLGNQWALVGGATVTPGANLTFDVSLFGLQRGETDVLPGRTSLGGDASLRWTPDRKADLGLGYRRYVNLEEAGSSSGDVISGNAAVRPVKALSLGGSGSASFTSAGLGSLHATGFLTVHASRAWEIGALWRGDFYYGVLDQTAHTATLMTTFRSRMVDWRTASEIAFRTREDATIKTLSFSTSLGWNIRRYLTLGLSTYGTAPIPSGPPNYGVNLSWTFRPTALPRVAGGLGLRGGVAGSVYLDENSNGVRDEGEEGLPGMVVTIDGERTYTTDADGLFMVRSLPVGEHRVSVDRLQFHALGPTTRTVRVAPGGREGVDFGVIWGGRIQGLLYEDLHGDGGYDNGDPGVPCDSVSLRTAEGVVVARTVADGGRFTFTGLAEGEYTVMVDAFGLPEGYMPLDDLEPTVFVEEGKPVNVRVRLHANRAIGGIVWEDVDRDREADGKKDLGIGGAEVYLSDGQVTRTGPDGSFLFRDLPPGAYAVRTELSTEARVVILPVEPYEVLDLAFVLPRGTRPPEPAPPSPRAPDSVAGLVLEAPITVLPQGVELQVTATAVLSNGETREVTTRANWSSSDDATVAVSPEGKVRGLAAGTAGVTAEWKGGVGDPLTFEVLGSPLDRITVSPVGLRLNPGNTADLRVDVVDKSGRGGQVTPVAVWSVADPRIARVDASGRLKALKDGVTTVQARIGESWSPPLEIQVITAAVTALSIENLPARMPEGATVQLKATGYDTRLEIQNVTESVTWASSDPAVVRVEPDGRIIAVGRGTAQITASIGSLFTRSRTVFVTNTPPLSLDIVPPGMTVSVYDLQRFRATATFEDGSRGAVTTVVEWIVDGTAADVRPDGTVLPREPGTVTVRARYLGVESQPVTVTVTP